MVLFNEDILTKLPKGTIIVNSNVTQKISIEYIKNIVIIYSYGKIYTNTSDSYIVLNSKGRNVISQKGVIYYLKELFEELDIWTKKNVKEFHFISSALYSRKNSSSVKNLSYSDIRKIKEMFPYIDRVVGVDGVIDQTSSMYNELKLSVEGTTLGTFNDIIKYGLLSDKVNKNLVQEFYIL